MNVLKIMSALKSKDRSQRIEMQQIFQVDSFFFYSDSPFTISFLSLSFGVSSRSSLVSRLYTFIVVSGHRTELNWCWKNQILYQGLLFIILIFYYLQFIFVCSILFDSSWSIRRPFSLSLSLLLEINKLNKCVYFLFISSSFFFRFCVPLIWTKIEKKSLHYLYSESNVYASHRHTNTLMKSKLKRLIL